MGGHVITLANGQKVHFPSRQQIMLAWIHDASTPPDLVAQVHTSLTMLCGEYQTMVRVTGMLKEDNAVGGAQSPTSSASPTSMSPRMAESDHRGRKMTNSYVGSLECLLSPTMEPRPDRVRRIAPETTTTLPSFVHADNARESVSTCFAGDVVRLRVVLRNCFGQAITNPSSRTCWTVYLCKTGDHSPPHVKQRKGLALDEHAELDAFQSNMRAVAEVLRTYDAGDRESCYLEFVVPRFTRQGEYRIELWKFSEKLAWAADFSAWVTARYNSDEVTIPRGSEYNQDLGLPCVGETVQLSQVDIRKGHGNELPERTEYTVCAVSGHTLKLDRPYLGIPPEGSRQMLRRVHDNDNVLFVQREILPRMATVSSKWRPCEFAHTRQIEYAPAEVHEATMSGCLSFFPGRGRGRKGNSSYIDRSSGVQVHGLILVLRVECSDIEDEGEARESNAMQRCCAASPWEFFVGYRYRVEGDMLGPTLQRRRRLEDESDLGGEEYVAHHEMPHAAHHHDHDHDHDEHHEDLHHHEKAKLIKFDMRFAGKPGEVVEAGRVPSDVLVSIRISSKIRHSQRYRLKVYIMGMGDDEVSVATKTGSAHEPYWDVHALRQPKSKAAKNLSGDDEEKDEEDAEAEAEEEDAYDGEDDGEIGEMQDDEAGGGALFGGENPMAAAQVRGSGVDCQTTKYAPVIMAA